MEGINFISLCIRESCSLVRALNVTRLESMSIFLLAIDSLGGTRNKRNNGTKKYDLKTIRHHSVPSGLHQTLLGPVGNTTNIYISNL